MTQLVRAIAHRYGHESVWKEPPEEIGEFTVNTGPTQQLHLPSHLIAVYVSCMKVWLILYSTLCFKGGEMPKYT